ncbi:MAG: 4Fe-4S dicluster domain-containing protein [Planctomycetes bacterium]|nr:4Fe-4S dicluster domain-containing protein [Planctomycetota bacterium]
MNDSAKKTYWKSFAQRDGCLDANEADPHQAGPAPFSRRHFLEAAGFTLSLATLSGCGRAPEVIALPFVDQPEGMIPGRSQTYASTCAGCPAACGLLVGVRDGRPLKMEGMPEHPLSRGGLCAIGQALPLGLYDSHRLAQPLASGKVTSWEDVDESITRLLGEVKQGNGAVRFVTSTVTSPTLKAQIDAFLAQYNDAKHVTFDAVSCSAILDAHEKTHAARVLPHYKLDQANVIVAFGADFLGTWISPVEFTAAWQTRRAPTKKHPKMSYHVQFEGRLSLTGGNADRRYRLSPVEYGGVLSHLATTLSMLAGEDPPAGRLSESPIAATEIDHLAEKLWDARGASLVLCDSQDVSVQVLVNFINHLLSNYNKTLDIQRPSRQRQGNDADVLNLVEELKAGKVAALFVAGTDLTHNLPDHKAIAAGISKAKLVVSFAERQDDFASLAHFVCPDHHPLESWLDAEPVAGLVSISQPTLQPLGGTRSILESLARWSGDSDSAYDILRASWRENVLPRVEPRPFQAFWDKAVHDGFVNATPIAPTVSEFQSDTVALVDAEPSGDDYTISLYSKVGLTDSRHAHNPWLQELPDPTTKITWDNYVCVSPTAAKELSLSNGDLVRVETDEGSSVELPTLVQPGQHDRVGAIALGYGVRGTDRFADIGPKWLEGRPTVAPGELVGKNVASLIETRDGELQYTVSGVTLTKSGGRRDLASTQEHHSLEIPRNVAPHGAEVRDIIQETTLEEFAQDSHAGTPHAHHHGDTQLWAEDHTKSGHSWGMVIDLNKCTGCSACLIACQSENNVPVVGKDEVRRQREMHWIRLDRYYSGAGDDVSVAHQPMMCHHCDNAPCETVCPVLATVHGDEGLNVQAYNRCVGTRYCANNCPYKVRRFNWFKYEREDALQNLVLNPDVTVRTRGVMEKCSMCVQRIEEGKIAARQRDEPVVDGNIQTACQQSCPAQAIVFGDMNDPESKVHGAFEDPRRYRLLEEFNFRPSVAYLRSVKNREAADGGEHHV